MCEATQVAGDPRAEGRARTTLTDVLLVSGRIEQAEEEARLAMELAADARDSTAISWVANDRGLICLHQGRPADGKAFFDQAIEGLRAAGNRPFEATSLCNLSRAHLGMGSVAKAVEIAQRGVAIHAEFGRTVRLANGHYAVGIALHRPAGTPRRSVTSPRPWGSSTTTGNGSGRGPRTSGSPRRTSPPVVPRRRPSTPNRRSRSGASAATVCGATS